MATVSAGIIGGKTRSPWNQTTNQRKNKTAPRRVRVCRASYSQAVSDPYKTLRIEHGASESEVKKAFRKLVLQYHPDVCRESNSGVQFHTINEAYDMVMRHLRGETTSFESFVEESEDDQTIGVYDDEYDWEEWMGWEGAGIRDQIRGMDDQDWEEWTKGRSWD